MSTDVDGAAEQGASLQSFADDAMKISGSLLQLIHLCHAASKVLKALGGAATRQRLIRAVQPENTGEQDQYADSRLGSC